jgi:hypothetical protein
MAIPDNAAPVTPSKPTGTGKVDMAPMGNIPVVFVPQDPALIIVLGPTALNAIRVKMPPLHPIQLRPPANINSSFILKASLNLFCTSHLHAGYSINSFFRMKYNWDVFGRD